MEMREMREINKTPNGLNAPLSLTALLKGMGDSGEVFYPRGQRDRFPQVHLSPCLFLRDDITSNVSGNRNFQEINYPSCGVGILPALNIGRVGTPIPQKNLGCFFLCEFFTKLQTTDVGQS
jgi:hypothetical protein